MDGAVSLEFMTGNPQLGVLSGRLTYLETSSNESSDGSLSRKEEKGHARTSSSSSSRREGSNSSTVADTTYSPNFNADVLLDHLPQRRGKLLCLLSVPAHMVPTDMLHFAAPFKEQVHSLRILRPCNPVGPSDPAKTPAEYMVLLQMESQEGVEGPLRPQWAPGPESQTEGG
ncbi:unnamed protein product [Ectocarpus sp. CCAP 1310/34]|nr:unnamed protein product [Ectocarpus sp. CCAP 1310/34]